MKQIFQSLLLSLLCMLALSSCEGKYVGSWEMGKSTEEVYGYYDSSVKLNLQSNGQGFMEIKMRSDYRNYVETSTFSWTVSKGCIELNGTYVKTSGYNGEKVETGLFNLRFKPAKNDKGELVLLEDISENHYHTFPRIQLVLTKSK